jgi:hypothetical protein
MPAEPCLKRRISWFGDAAENWTGCTALGISILALHLCGRFFDSRRHGGAFGLPSLLLVKRGNGGRRTHPEHWRAGAVQLAYELVKLANPRARVHLGRRNRQCADAARASRLHREGRQFEPPSATSGALQPPRSLGACAHRAAGPSIGESDVAGRLVPQ